ncbi:MAG: GNAT family N-acetyltransferase [Candidatus Bathyarchaeota archaeon]|nr:MAG: GNAT family N-acetyltransferase [Candidatus Bathyarchaeota archaeon]
MQTTFIIRRFKPADLKQVMKINRTCLPENYSSGFFMSIFQRFPESFVVAEATGATVGYAMCRVENRFGFGLFGGAKKGHLISIAVLPDSRRCGIASELMKGVMTALVDYGCGDLFLEVRVSNVGAVQLYKKLGFLVDRRIRHYYADGEAAYVMRRKLPLES